MIFYIGMYWWIYLNSCFFFNISGYGHVTPLSEGGKIFCIVYALIGIPLTLIMFTAIAERLMIITGKLQIILMDTLSHLCKPFHIRLLHLTLILCFLAVFTFLIPAAIFCVLEHDWNFLDAFYYCFISMTTIGLGDYIPGDKPNQPNRVVYKIITTCKFKDTMVSLTPSCSDEQLLFVWCSLSDDCQTNVRCLTRHLCGASDIRLTIIRQGAQDNCNCLAETMLIWLING